MNELAKRIGWVLLGLIIGAILCSNLDLYRRVSKVETINAQIVDFLNQAQKQQPAQIEKPK